jgi:hypothetical protein
MSAGIMRAQAPALSDPALSDPALSDPALSDIDVESRNNLQSAIDNCALVSDTLSTGG